MRTIVATPVRGLMAAMDGLGRAVFAAEPDPWAAAEADAARAEGTPITGVRAD